jgi:hypothetical protein
MEKMFRYIDKTVRGFRTKACRNGCQQALGQADERFIVKDCWLACGYYDRLWDLTPEMARPRGMYAPWLRRFA